MTIEKLQKILNNHGLYTKIAENAIIGTHIMLCDCNSEHYERVWLVGNDFYTLTDGKIDLMAWLGY